ncbi:MAG: SAVED domain-containing protein [Methylophilaceae bacterium]|nr:SAVED domain-containing protein [Methylophilaceae bacterium]
MKIKSVPSGQSPAYLQYLQKVKELSLSCGAKCEVLELAVLANAPCIKEWATQFRQNYCLDADIDSLRHGTGKTRAEYLLELVFPDAKIAPGPSIRAGDFAELLIADYIEFVLKYSVPRDKYAMKAIRNESVKGVDIVGFKRVAPDDNKPEDEMLTFEVKAHLSNSQDSVKGALQNAVDHSSKDYIRDAETLAAMKRRMRQAQAHDSASLVERFQNPVDKPYVRLFGAAAVLSKQAYDCNTIRKTSTTGHINPAQLMLIVVKGHDLMTLAHTLYQQAANET